MTSWRRFRYRESTAPEDFYKLDPKKSNSENAYDIFVALSSKSTTDNKRLYLLNGFATLFQQSDDNGNLGFTTEELLYCLSTSLVHNLSQVRAAALRAIRYLLKTPKDLHIFNLLQLPHLVCKSIDLLLKDDVERMQALKLIRKMLSISPESITPTIVRCLVSMGDSGIEERDRMLRACLATLCEFGVLNPTLLIVCGGVRSITRNVLECQSPRIAESLCGVLLHLLEWPHTRNLAAVRLDCLAAPYCDFTYRLGIMDKNKNARELRYTSSRLALLSVLRSWAGTIEFCDPNKPSGLKAIVDVLYLNQLEVRKAILDLLYEVLGLPQPAWTDEYSVALQAVDPSDFQDAWLLSNGFVAMEGRSILPSLANRVPNICEQHLALLLYCFLETGLINALIEVIVSSDTFISVRATVLVGKLLHLMHKYLPADICATNTTLSSLISHATAGNHQANAAISALQNYNQMLKNRPASCSLFLDNIIQAGSLVHSRIFKREINTQYELSNILPPLLNTIERRRLDSVSSSASGGDETIISSSMNTSGHHSTLTSSSLPSSSSGSGLMKRSSFRVKRKKISQFFEGLREFDRLIKDSNVLVHADGNQWDWEIVIAILRSDAIGKLDDTKCRFLKRLEHYFKPSSNRFSHQDLSHGRNIPAYVTAGLDLIDWMLQSSELECTRLLTDLFHDISNQLLAISTSNRAHDCLFSPQHMSSTMCQHYFLFIGRMCRHERGLTILSNTGVFKQLTNLVTTTFHVCYIKLIVTGLDYTLDAEPRRILEQALTISKARDGRLYATQFMLVLLRAKVPNFEIWGIPMIINQIKDQERRVVLAALEILEETCHDKLYLEELVSIWPDLTEMREAGKILMSRYYSIPRGLNHPQANVKVEIELWKNEYNKKYVLLVEAETHASLTLHIKNEDGFYSRRTCQTRPVIIPPNIQPHLYGQLVQTEQGFKDLKKYGDIPYFIDVLNKSKCADENESLELKSALWILGHLSTHSNGVEYLVESANRVYHKIIFLATFCEVYSIRATAFHVLGLVGNTHAGANVLYKLDWLCVRHDRDTMWPVYQPEDWETKQVTPVRHQFEPVPPYNYAGISENINGFNTSSDSNSFLTDDHHINCESKNGSLAIKDENPCQNIAATNKSRTLPENNSMKYKHTRSLSESKTTDVISLISASGYQSHHRTRFNSGTDSNTSGVSSSESIFGKNIIGEYIQMPLSPIPSTSNLLEIPSTKCRFRRVSLVSGSSVQEPSMSPQDMEGYRMLRQLRSHTRPVLSESAADDLAEIIDRDEVMASLRPRKTSIGSDSQRKMKVRSLDRRATTQNIISKLHSDEFQVPLPTLAAPKFLSLIDSKGPCYSGICLPKNIIDLFPSKNQTQSYITRDIQDNDLLDINLLTVKQQFLNESVNNAVDVDGDSSIVSSVSDISSASKHRATTKWISKHTRSNCLSCARLRSNRLQQNQRLQFLTSNIIDDNSNSELNIFKRKSNQSSSIQLSDISFNSPESILSEENMPDRIACNILYQVQRMSNPISAKLAKNALLELKQKHPNSFQDICLYSEVCKAIGRTSHRMGARRFLQELFLDLNFDSFYNEPIEIIVKKDKDIISISENLCVDDTRNSATASTVLVGATNIPIEVNCIQLKNLRENSKLHQSNNTQNSVCANVNNTTVTTSSNLLLNSATKNVSTSSTLSSIVPTSATLSSSAALYTTSPVLQLNAKNVIRLQELIAEI
ncbi:rapamycin-insensitive companion of mTOR isoform X2 [Condylostylus longicornis]|uniref:rapamycin-insensitive companion of mTOR isoform X2 n=1 Tax=Condylostylus longicornis TaxID=2530218 RepID=UPI00244E1741|nr:rapamycin-insensitive companion of mTOR isoform X2 [Condylostylus longicornis]